MNNVIIESDGEEDINLTWDDFKFHNDGFSEADFAEVEEGLNKDGFFVIGGGAAAKFTIRKVS